MLDELSGVRDRGAVLEVASVGKVYATKGGQTEALRDITFSVGQGEFVCIVGPSGSGKTTLLKCIAGLLSPTSGEARFSGRRIGEPPEGLAVVFQEYGRSLFPWMSVAANVGLALKPMGLAKAECQGRVIEALRAVGLEHVSQSYPWQLSGGMQQRVAIARAVASQPRLLLMDEPFAAVDAQTRAELEDLVRRLWHQFGMTILFVTHDVDESVYLGGRVLVLSGAPTVIQENLEVDLPDVRDQLTTRRMERFVELRAHVYEQIQLAKRRNVAAGGT